MLVMGGDRPVSQEDVVIGGEPMVKKVYDTKNYYFNQNGVLSMIEVTKPVVENALDRAVEAFQKAASLDEKGQKAKDITGGLSTIAGKLNDEAYNAYLLGDLAKASNLFEKVGDVSALIPGGSVDSNAIYNAGFTAFSTGDMARAKNFFQKSIALGYDGENGDAYAKLADIAAKEGNQEESRSILEGAFTKYPQSQSILIGLINSYMSGGDNTDRLFELIDGAKKNEPNNATLYYSEGQIHEKLGNIEAAAKAYDESVKVNPSYEYGYIGKGILYYNRAADLQEAASNEMDDAKYNQLVKDFEVSLKACVEPFEKAYEISTENKRSIAEYLKNACFRFRTESDEWMAKYNKYNAAVSE